VNSSSALSIQWIKDHGVNNIIITHNDKVISGYPADNYVVFASLASFDEHTNVNIQGVSARLFTPCHDFSTSANNVNIRALKILTVHQTSTVLALVISRLAPPSSRFLSSARLTT
jgi:hypothetical protein